jgi:transcriptional regulator of heat shock response
VNDLMLIEPLPAEEIRAIEDIIAEVQEEQELMSEVSRLLGKLTRQLGVAVSPAVEQALFRDLSLVPLDSNRIMLVLSLSGMVFRSTLVDSALDTSISPGIHSPSH